MRVPEVLVLVFVIKGVVIKVSLSLETQEVVPESVGVKVLVVLNGSEEIVPRTTRCA